MIWTPRLTVAAVIERDGKFLMVEERDENNDRNVYNQPAGHVENHESIQAAIIREVKEETAWDFSPEYIVGLYKWRKHDIDTTFIRLCFAGSVSNHASEQELDDGILAANWWSFEEVMSIDSQLMRSPMVWQCINDYRHEIKYPLDFITEC